MKKLALAFALALSAVTTACGSDDPAPAPTPAADSGTPAGDSGTPAGNGVVVKSNEFSPATITIKVGQEVTWTWAGGTHNVVSGAGCVPDMKFTSGAPVGTVGNTFKQKFDTAGTVEYFCNPHCGVGMKGTVVVQ